MLEGPCWVRPEVAAAEPYVAGLSVDEIREKYKLSRVIKMASNENPLGASSLVQEAIKRAAGMAFRYPQSGNPRLTAAIAARHGVAAGQVVAGNGSDEIIDLLIRARAVPGRHNVVAFKPCFSLYRLQSLFCGVEFRQTQLRPDFTFDWAGLWDRVDENTALVFVTSPDNPTGYCPPAGELEDLARRLPAGALLVVDEAYMDFCGDEAAHSLLPRLPSLPNVAILRTFSKSYGLAGLRLGYGILPLELAEYLWRVRLPFSINILAEEAGLAALQDSVFRAETLRVTAEGRELLSRELTALGCQVFPSWANFLLVRPPADGPASRTLFEGLLAHGIIIRPLASYGLPEYLRVSVGNREENQIFLSVMRELLAVR